MKKKSKFKNSDIPKYLKKFKEGNNINKGLFITERYTSFDYCYNYFHSYKNKKNIASKKNILQSCLHLGFYLASWGMLRGSSFLLQKSIKHYEPLIKEISIFNKQIWEIDVNNYNEKNIQLLLDCYNMIIEKLDAKKNQNKIIATKIMLGVFGCVPALDTYFCKSFGNVRFTQETLEKIKYFYTENKETINKERKQFKTIDFHTGRVTKKCYSIAKIIDMIHFSRGIEIKTNQ